MELTDLEQRTQAYAAHCFDGRYALIQQIAIDLSAKLLNASVPWEVFYSDGATPDVAQHITIKDIPRVAVQLATGVLDEIDKETDNRRDQLREYYAARYRRLTTDWDQSKFSSEAWLKKAFEPEQGPKQ